MKRHDSGHDTENFNSLRKRILIQCYAPSELANIEEKGAFYESLENTLQSIKISEMTTVWS